MHNLYVYILSVSDWEFFSLNKFLGSVLQIKKEVRPDGKGRVKTTNR